MPYGLPPGAVERIWGVLAGEPGLQCARALPSRTLGRERRGSEIDLSLEGLDLGLDALFSLENRLEALGLPWKIDLLLWNQIDDPVLKGHIERAGKVLYALDGRERVRG